MSSSPLFYCTEKHLSSCHRHLPLITPPLLLPSLYVPFPSSFTNRARRLLSSPKIRVRVSAEELLRPQRAPPQLRFEASPAPHRAFRSFLRLSPSPGSNLGQWGRSSWRPVGVGSRVTGFRSGGAGARRRAGRRERSSLAGDLRISGNLP